VNINAKLTSVHVTVILAVLVLSVAGCSYSSRPVSNTNNAPVAQSGVGTDSAGGEVASPLPRPSGFVADYAKVLDSASRANLQSTLTHLRDESSIEFAVVTVESTGGQPIFDYSLAVARSWGIGPKDQSKGGGLLLMLAIKDRQWRIQVSRSLEKDLPAEFLTTFGKDLEDSCRQGKYAEGITRFVDAIIKRLEETRALR
jgi:uncharacterized protein